MKLLKTDTQNLVRRLEGAGLFTSEINYKASEPSGELTYTGPKIPKEMWQQVLSFFKWTYDTTQSESQVRLFVSPKLGTWKAWAFPQQAQSGLSTKELTTEDAKKQRAGLFENHDDWTAWGTVHHHCGISAFQSGTDEADERNQGGLHITVGDMDKPQHSMHARLYHQSDMYEVDMSKFWDIGPVIESLPVEIRAMLPANCGDGIARNQMCVPSSVPFPEQWKSNLIKVESRPTAIFGWDGWDYTSAADEPEKDGDYKWMGGKRYQRQNGVWKETPWEAGQPQQAPSNEGRKQGGKRRRTKSSFDPLPVRSRDAADALVEVSALYNINEFQAEQLLSKMIADEFIENVFQACKEFDVLPADILEVLQRDNDLTTKNGGGPDERISDL